MLTFCKNNTFMWLIFLFGLITNCVAQEQNPAIGRAAIGLKEGLQFTAEISSQTFKANDTLIVLAKFKNLTNEILYISKRQFAANDLFFDYAFTTKTGGLVLGRVLAEYKQPSLSEVDFVPIPPGEIFEIEKRIQLSDYSMEPGEYILTITYHSLWQQDDIPNIQKLWGREYGTLYADVTVSGKSLPRPTTIRIIE